jgi:RNA recognition motif-containing protein
VFKVAGKVVNADILMDQAGKSKGLGEVQFEDQGDAISAIGM